MKTLFKKSISLFLTVLMLLSCWVWVAPDKAEAVAASTSTSDACTSITPVDKYTVKLGFTLNNNYEWGDEAYVRYRIWYIPNNGTGTPTTGSTYVELKDYNLSGTNGQNYYLTTTLSGFPYYIEACSYRKTKSTLKLWEAGKIQYEFVYNYVEVIGADGCSSGDIFTDQFTISQKSNSNESDTKAWLIKGYTKPYDNTTHDQDGVPMPRLAGFDSATSKGINLTLDKIKTDSQDASGSDTYTYGTYFDQYGVKWTGPTASADSMSDKTVTYTIKNGGKAVEDTNISVDTNGKVTAKPGLQTSMIAKSEKKALNLTLEKTYTTPGLQEGATIKSTITSDIEITYPDYTVNFNSPIAVDYDGDSNKFTKPEGYKYYKYSQSNIHNGADLKSVV